MKIKITESELVKIIKNLVESGDDMKLRMKRRRAELLELIQDEVAQEGDPNNYDDEFEYADNILTWAIDRFTSQPNNEWFEDRYDDVFEYAKNEFAEELFDNYRFMIDGDEPLDEHGERFENNIVEGFRSEQLHDRDEIIKMLKGSPPDLRSIVRKLPIIPCEDGNGNQKNCIKIPEVIYVYLTSRY